MYFCCRPILFVMPVFPNLNVCFLLLCIEYFVNCPLNCLKVETIVRNKQSITKLPYNFYPFWILLDKVCTIWMPQIVWKSVWILCRLVRVKWGGWPRSDSSGLFWYKFCVANSLIEAHLNKPTALFLFEPYFLIISPQYSITIGRPFLGLIHMAHTHSCEAGNTRAQLWGIQSGRWSPGEKMCLLEGIPSSAVRSK